MKLGKKYTIQLKETRKRYEMEVMEKKMTKAEYRKSPEFLKEISFRELVKAIDAKWGHTYEDIKEEDV
jgi:hypothetical protein